MAKEKKEATASRESKPKKNASQKNTHQPKKKKPAAPAENKSKAPAHKPQAPKKQPAKKTEKPVPKKEQTSRAKKQSAGSRALYDMVDQVKETFRKPKHEEHGSKPKSTASSRASF